MENFLWQKTLLDMYKIFGRVVMITDNKFNKVVSRSLFDHNTKMLLDELTGLMARKNNCLFAKELCDKGFEHLACQNKNILCSYHKHKMSFKNIAQKEGINLRQVFRKYDKELQSFSYFLTKQGYGACELEKEFGADNLFAYAYQKIANKSNIKAQVCVQLPYSYNDDSDKIDYDSNVANEAGDYCRMVLY